MENTHKRHGDINLSPVTKSEGEIIKHNGTFIVAHGESGHKHVLTVSNPNDLTIRKDINGDMYFELLSDGLLSHEEHKTLTVRPGIYKKIVEREFDWFQLAARTVID